MTTYPGSSRKHFTPLFYFLFFSAYFLLLPMQTMAQKRSTRFMDRPEKRVILVRPSFTYNPSSPTAGQEIQFTDTSRGSLASWQWDFGDGTTSNDQSPSHAFSTPGTYRVKLTAGDRYESREVTRAINVLSSASITSFEVGAASFTYAPASPVAGSRVQFTDTSTNSPTSWLWDFGDGGSSQTQNPGYTYSVAGSYAVTMTAKSGSDSTSVSKTVTIFANIITAASPSFEDVSSAISSAKLGDTVMIPGGSATWTQQLVITNGIRIIGAGIGKTIITRNFAGDKSTYLIKYVPDAASKAADAFFRWSGCTFIFTGQMGSCFNLLNRPDHTPMTRNRIDHCAFVDLNQNARALEVDGIFWGVFDNNTMNSGTLEVYGSNEVSWTYTTATPGGADNFFFEDNVIYYTGTNYGFGSGCGGRYCARYNTIDVTGVDGTVQMFDVHGSMYTDGNLGSMICEFYNNIVTAGPKGVEFGDLRGGYGFIHNNLVTTTYTVFGPSIREELMDTICLPANNVIDGTPQHVHDSYIFNNIMRKGGVDTRFDWIPNGSVDYAAGQTDTTNRRFYPPARPYRVVPQEGLDFWTQHDSFNGTIGVGVGPLADRPSKNLVVGVGYWATDTKTLYRWTATEGWEVYYKPYPYPHPLRDIQ